MKNNHSLICWLVVLLLFGIRPIAQAQNCGVAVSILGVSTTANTAAISFVPVAGASSYTVECYASGSSLGQTFTITGSPALFTDMLPGTAYTGGIIAHCANGIASPGAYVGFSTPGVVGNCGYISNVQTTSLSPTTATLSFAPVVGATGYRIWYHTSASVTTASPSVSVTSSPVTLTGLLPGTNYRIEMVASCANGGLTQVYSGSFGTTSVSNCGMVSNVTVTATSSSTATVSYTPGNGNTSFNISWSTPGDSTHRTYSSTSTAVLTGLIPGHTYTVQVSSNCGTTGTPTYSGAINTNFSFRGALTTHTTFDERRVSVFPNPAHHFTSLLLPAVASATKAQLTLLNALGQVVLHQSVTLLEAHETPTQVDLTSVPAGLYILRIAAGGQTTSQHLAVE